ncbi:MAG: hypothetical protein LKE37_05085 [Atopobiaceae bacterium]|jgi:hypothetical protein|nr:hypothetical protein [Atopobiaceae bacterium]
MKHESKIPIAINAKVSKFDHEAFIGEGGTFYAVSKERYSLEEATAIAERELECPVVLLEVDWVARHRAGIDDWGDPRVGWWLDDGPLPRSCPVWSFEPRDSRRDGDAA